MPTDNTALLTQWIAEELSLSATNVRSVVALLNDGATVPFIARYRKEATGALDEVAVRDIREQHTAFSDLLKRRDVVLSTIEEQGKLTPELRARIEATRVRQELEDLYLPFRPKRRTRASMARERGLEPLADALLAQDTRSPKAVAQPFVDPDNEVADVDAALAGASDIVAEQVAEHPDLRAFAREHMAKHGVLHATMHPDAKGKRTKYEQYYDYQERIAGIPSHRFLAIRRGEREEILRTKLVVDETPIVERAQTFFNYAPSSPWAPILQDAIVDAWKRLLRTSLDTDIRVTLKQRSDEGAVHIFANNLREMLMAAPLGGRSVIGIDPGQRTGCKVAVVSNTGAFQHNTTLFLHRGSTGQAAARNELLELVKRYNPFAIAVGNGTAGRETERFVRTTLKEEGLQDVIVVLVNESGASIYSASDVAREEFPDLDLTIRGAISIARRLQDPLSELVKIDPQSIGVGQYQHDVAQTLLKKKLAEVIESCVNGVGVEVNTASAPLLAHVAGIGPTLAKRIVAHRDEHGPFPSRKALRDVRGLGPRAYEQCAGFLRVAASDNPLDRSAVHPERYALVQDIAKSLSLQLDELVGNDQHAKTIDPNQYVREDVGKETLIDIIAELRKPGRDPRDAFEPPKFREDVQRIEDLKPGMILPSIVTNVTAFGAFVDLGVGQDGLVHISQLADRFVRDPSEVVSHGQNLQVKVMDVDIPRARISLSARLDEPLESERGAGASKEQRPANRGGGRNKQRRSPAPKATPKRPQNDSSNLPFADLLKGKN